MACTSESISLRITREGSERSPLRERLALIWYTLEQWRERARQRRAMLALDDHLLRDIGISRADVEREASKPFWIE